MSCPWDKEKPNISVELYNLTFFLSHWLTELRSWHFCYLCGLQVKCICLLLRFVVTQCVITSSCTPLGVYVHDVWWPVMPSCLCQDLLVVGPGLPQHASLSRRAFVSSVWGLDVELPISKRAVSSPRGLRLRIVICAPYGACVFVSFFIRVTSRLRREDNEAHYGAQGLTEWLIFL